MKEIWQQPKFRPRSPRKKLKVEKKCTAVPFLGAVRAHDCAMHLFVILCIL
ncbi:hypothetical protein HanPI659440_Chr15g0609171 [Helianthus annuus]|nr:hypothetical protein HanPI659440_Chr15g0609171 [Helianthus annuus]